MCSSDLTIVNIVGPGKHIAEETRTELVARYAGDASQKQADAYQNKKSFD